MQSQPQKQRGSLARRADRFWDGLAALSQRRAPWLSALGALIFAVSTPFAIRLYGDLRTDLRELLPHGAPAADALDALERRVGGLGQLSVIVRTDDLKAGERFIDALEARVKNLPKDLVQSVTARVDDERQFFDAHGALYADASDLARVRDGLRQRIEQGRKRANPLAVDLLDEESPDGQPPARAALDTENLVATFGKLKEAFARLDHFTDGYLAGEGGKTLVLNVQPANAGIGLEFNQRLYSAVAGIVGELRPQGFHPSLRIGYSGEVRSVIEAQEALVRDLVLSSTLVLLAVGAALFLFYRSLWAIPLLVGPLFTGTALTFAVSRGVIHYLNPNTAFLGSIIIGNGINAGIILLARYLEERRAGRDVAHALPTALKSTWLATFAASAAAAASYGSLGATRFRGFNQFALMGTVGMLLCWLCTYLLMPAFIVLAERMRPLGTLGKGSDGKAKGLVAAPFGRFIVGWPRTTAALSIVLSIGAAGLVLRLARDPLQYDFSKLGSREGEQFGANHWGKHVDAVMQSYQTPTVVLTSSADRSEAVARSLEETKRAQGTSSTIDSVATLQKLLPGNQPRKLALLREIFEMLTPAVVGRLPADIKPLVQRLKASTQLSPISFADVPTRLTSFFKEKNGQSGRLVLVYPTLKSSADNGKNQIEFARSIRRAALTVDPTVQVAGQVILSSDIIEMITEDGAFAAVLSFLAVSGITLLVLRSVRDAAWVIGSLCLGTLGMAGAMGLLELKFNFVNFVVLPITFGIGVDYAVNLYQRYLQTGSVEESLASSGGAVALCSTTTIIGYAALLMADNMAIYSFGLTAVLGEVTCLSAALFALPAFLAWRDSRAAPKLPAQAPAAIPAAPEPERATGT